MKRKGRKSSSKHDKEVENGGKSSDDQDSVENEERADTSAKNFSGEDSEGEEKSKKRSRSSRKAADSDNDSEDEEKSKSKKKSKKRKSTKSTENGDKEGSEEPEEDYEVEAVLDEKKIRGVKHYLIRWKGYESESDTWEPESTLNCPELIEEFKSKHKPGSKSPTKEKSKAKPTDEKKKKKKREKKDDKKEEVTWDENEDFEVERILEVHFRRDGSREFLVHWKGYPSSEDTWEPEEHMDCKDMIEKFMEKVEKAKAVDTRELRTNRSHTNRFTLSMDAKGRRLSKRFQGKQRATYHDAE